MSVWVVYPEGAVGDVDLPPGDNDGVFYGFCGNVNAEEGAVSIICYLNVDGEALCVLQHKHKIHLDPIKNYHYKKEEIHIISL